MWAGRWGAAALGLGLLLLLVPGNVSLFSHRLALPAARRAFTHLPSSFVQLLNTLPAKRSAKPLILKFSTVKSSSCFFLRFCPNFCANMLSLIIACLLSLQVSG